MIRIKPFFIAWLFLLFPLIATASSDIAGSDAATSKLIKQLGLKQAEQAIRQAPHWRKPKRIVITMLDRQLKSKPDAIERLPGALRSSSPRHERSHPNY